MKQKNLCVLVGAPGSGKSSCVKKTIEESEYGCFHASRDKIRFALLGENDDYFSHEPLVYETWINVIKSAIDSESAKYDTIYVDATNLSVMRRRELFTKLDLPNRKHQVRIIMLVFRPSLETCLERNSHRTGNERVPDSVVRRMYRSLEMPKQDEFEASLGIVYGTILLHQEEDE